MSLIHPPTQSKFNKNVPYLPIDFAGLVIIFLFPPKSKAHFAREKGGTSSMEPRSSPPREADSRCCAVVPLLQKGVVFRCSAPFVVFRVRFVCCLLCWNWFFIKEKNKTRIFCPVPAELNLRTLEKTNAFWPKRIHQGANCFSKTLYSGFILEEYLRFNQKKKTNWSDRKDLLL